MAAIDIELAAIASRQRQLITMADVLAVGGARHHVQSRVEGGRLLRVDDGVYLQAGAPFDWPTRQLAAVLAAGPGSLTSFFAAARVLRFNGFTGAGNELSIPRGRRYRRPDVRTHESSDLDLAGGVVRGGIPVTGPDRTVLDLGRYLGVPRLRRVVEDARRDQFVTWSSLIDVLLAHARRGRPGIRRLRSVILLDADRDEVTDSEFERIVLGLILEAGLPAPELHHKVFDAGRFVAEVDMAYPPLKVAIECDGAVHLQRKVRERDLERQNDLMLCGWLVIRFTWQRVQHRPEVVGLEVREAIRRTKFR